MRALLAELGEHRVVAGDRRAERPPAAVAPGRGRRAAGRRTVLLECDLAAAALAAELGLAAGPGLHEYLRWEATPAQILQPLVLAGPAAAGAAAPLVCVGAGAPGARTRRRCSASESFRHAIAKLRGAYDLVVLVGPPLGSDRWALDAVGGRGRRAPRLRLAGPGSGARAASCERAAAAAGRRARRRRRRREA